MAIKRTFNVKNGNARTCLKCGRVIPKEKLIDDTPYICQWCGQKHFVDIYGGASCCLTVAERPELRRRHTDYKTPAEVKLALKLADVEKSNKEWKAAAEGLARMVENLTEEAKRGEDPGV